MKKLLHIIATPRQEESRTLQVTQEFLKVFIQNHADWGVEELNISKEQLPSLTVKQVDGKYALLGGKELSGELKEAWKDIIVHIERFMLADAYLISTPMWNFSIPYTLKQYIDIILQPRYLFRYTPSGVEGLMKNKKMAIIISRGGDYGPDSPMHNFDFQEPYLRAVFGFVGITDISFVIAQPMDALGPQVQAAKIEEAKSIARKVAVSF
jgi:FMN-dependent NADH-azoreductase